MDNPRLGEGFDEILPKLEFKIDSFWSDNRIRNGLVKYLNFYTKQ